MKQRCHIQEKYSTYDEEDIATFFCYSYEDEQCEDRRWIIGRWNDTGAVFISVLTVTPSEWSGKISLQNPGSSISQKIISTEYPYIRIVEEQIISKEEHLGIVVDNEEDWERYVEDPKPLITLAIIAHEH